MARFIAVQELPAVATQDEVIEAGKALANGRTNGTRWLRSWVVPEDGHLLSEWEARDEGDVRSALGLTPLFAVVAVHAVTVIEPAWFRL